MDTERSSNRILLGSIQSLYVEVVQETDIKITVKQPVDGWNVGHINPQVRVLYILYSSPPPLFLQNCSPKFFILVKRHICCKCIFFLDLKFPNLRFIAVF